MSRIRGGRGRRRMIGQHSHQQNYHIHSTTGQGAATGLSIYYPDSPEHSSANTYDGGDHLHQGGAAATHKHNVPSHKHLSHNNGFWIDSHYSIYDDNNQVVDYTYFQDDATHQQTGNPNHMHGQQIHRHMQIPGEEQTRNQVYSGYGQGENAQSILEGGYHQHRPQRLPQQQSPTSGVGGIGGNSIQRKRRHRRRRKISPPSDPWPTSMGMKGSSDYSVYRKRRHRRRRQIRPPRPGW